MGGKNGRTNLGYPMPSARGVAINWSSRRGLYQHPGCKYQCPQFRVLLGKLPGLIVSYRIDPRCLHPSAQLSRIVFVQHCSDCNQIQRRFNKYRFACCKKSLDFAPVYPSGFQVEFVRQRYGVFFIRANRHSLENGQSLEVAQYRQRRVLRDTASGCPTRKADQEGAEQRPAEAQNNTGLEA